MNGKIAAPTGSIAVDSTCPELAGNEEAEEFDSDAEGYRDAGE